MTHDDGRRGANDMERDMERDGGAEGVAQEMAARLERAWNAADADAFGAPFAADADFVDIRGDHHRGRAAIVAGHRAILGTIYRGSTIAYRVTGARPLADGVLLVHTTGDLTIPAGPMAGAHRAQQSYVLVRRGGGWEIAAFHNTLVAPPPPRG